MSYYLIAKFLHIVGALGFFVALGVEWLSLSHARQAATSEQVRERLQISNSAHRVAMPSMLMALLSGVYMTATVWGGVAWIIVSLGVLVLLILLALTVSGPRMAAIRQALTIESEAGSPSLHELLHNSLLWLSLRTRVSIALGIVFLMTFKPDLTGSLITVGVTLLLGLLFSLPVKGRSAEKVGAQPADKSL